MHLFRNGRCQVPFFWFDGLLWLTRQGKKTSSSCSTEREQATTRAEKKDVGRIVWNVAWQLFIGWSTGLHSSLGGFRGPLAAAGQKEFFPIVSGISVSFQNAPLAVSFFFFFLKKKNQIVRVTDRQFFCVELRRFSTKSVEGSKVLLADKSRIRWRSWLLKWRTRKLIRGCLTFFFLFRQLLGPMKRILKKKRQKGRMWRKPRPLPTPLGAYLATAIASNRKEAEEYSSVTSLKWWWMWASRHPTDDDDTLSRAKTDVAGP